MRLPRYALALSSMTALLLSACTYESAYERQHRLIHGTPRYLWECEGWLARGEPDRAEHWCDVAVELSPEFADVWAKKGLVALARADTAKAKQHFLKALQYDPDHQEARMGLGSTYLQEGAYEQARMCFSQVLKSDPDFLPARYALGLALSRLGRKTEARKELDAVLP